MEYVGEKDLPGAKSAEQVEDFVPDNVLYTYGLFYDL